MNHMNFGSLTLTFADQEKIETSEFADFLYLFRGVYAASLHVFDSSSESVDDPKVLAGMVIRYLKTVEVEEIESLFQRDLGQYGLLTERVHYHSPIELVVAGSILAITAAVILSGGTFEAWGVKAELRPIGEGIKKLREALTATTRAPTGYGIKSKTIKLSKQEFEELMRQDPGQRDKGGFQRFLVSLQYRVHRRTRRLELSEKDMDRILRHGRRPRRGGWQAQIRRIFGRHFDLDDNI
jgi:hypothetical protein